jgi:hypothetical protein
MIKAIPARCRLRWGPLIRFGNPQAARWIPGSPLRDAPE